MVRRPLHHKRATYGEQALSTTHNRVPHLSFFMQPKGAAPHLAAELPRVLPQDALGPPLPPNSDADMEPIPPPDDDKPAVDDRIAAMASGMGALGDLGFALQVCANPNSPKH
jgi:hypothetical protein